MFDCSSFFLNGFAAKKMREKCFLNVFDKLLQLNTINVRIIILKYFLSVLYVIF